MIAGGGTGGHVIPALAIADALKSAHAAEICFIGTARGMETRLVPQAGYALELIDVGQLNRVSLATKLKTLVALPRGILYCLDLLRRWKPQVVVGVGGYASCPAMLAPRAPQSAPRLLVMGGSQGARALNQKMPQIAKALLESVPGLTILHQAGARHAETTQAAYAASGASADRWRVQAFLEDMPAQFAASDLILARSGASTVAELAASGKPSLLVPFPEAADDHQRKNAEVLVEGGAAAMLLEQDMTEASLLDALTGLLSTPAKLQEMATCARTFAYPQAAARIAWMVAGLPSSPSPYPSGNFL